MYWIEQLLNGVLQGSIYALIVIGYTLIVGIVGLPSFAYGDTVMYGAFLSYFIFNGLGNNVILAVICCFIGTAILGAITHLLCYEPFYDSPWHIPLMCTIGLGILIRNIAQIITKSMTLPIDKVFGEGYVEFGTIRITHTQLIVIAIVIILCLGFTIFLKKSRLGIEFKAVSQDRRAAALVGIDVSKVSILGNAIGCGMGGLAGMLFSIYYGTFRATMGGAIGMKAFSSAVLGGMGDITVSAVCGVIIGILENIGIALTSTGYRDMVAFLFLIVMLMLKPTGFSKMNTVKPLTSKAKKKEEKR
jgi:branched-chain amino acid transport system permease protein